MKNKLLADLGWSAHFLSQLDLSELSYAPARVAAVHRTQLDLITSDGVLHLSPNGPTGEFAVGDWVLVDDNRVIRRLDRLSLLERRAAGSGAESQLIAANVDTLFVVTSCNADFNPARIERYLALAAEAETEAVVLLTKADLCDNPSDYVQRAEQLSQGLIAIALNACAPEVGTLLQPWTKPGRAVALLGSSGVGKTTLTNTLTGQDQATQGMRELRLTDVSDGIDEVFSDVTNLAKMCRFRNCAHETEPGCAVLAAIDRGELNPDRLKRWNKLKREDRFNSETLAESRARTRKFGREVKKAVALKDQLNARRR